MAVRDRTRLIDQLLSIPRVGKMAFSAWEAPRFFDDQQVGKYDDRQNSIGMVVVGLPYTEIRQTTVSEISGGSPYGASTIGGPDVSRQPSQNELLMAKSQGKYVAELTKALKRGREG